MPGPPPPQTPHSGSKTDRRQVIPPPAAVGARLLASASPRGHTHTAMATSIFLFRNKGHGQPFVFCFCFCFRKECFLHLSFFMFIFFSFFFLRQPLTSSMQVATCVRSRGPLWMDGDAGTARWPLRLVRATCFPSVDALGAPCGPPCRLSISSAKPPPTGSPSPPRCWSTTHTAIRWAPGGQPTSQGARTRAVRRGDGWPREMGSSGGITAPKTPPRVPRKPGSELPQL